MITNPSKAKWVNSTQGTDQTGKTVAWDPSADQAAVEVAFDGQAAIDVPVTPGAAELDLLALDAYKALPAGQHEMTIAEVTKEGIVGDPSVQVPFQIGVKPAAPTSVVLA